jgi:hypothetical protein
MKLPDETITTKSQDAGDQDREAVSEPYRAQRPSGKSGARDLEVVADVDDPAGHQRGDDHRVVFGLGADMAAQRDHVVLGLRRHVAAVRDQRRALQRLFWLWRVWAR